MGVESIGGFCFGLVVGWVTYRSLRRREGNAALSDLSTVLAAVGGAAVTNLFAGEVFSWYAIGLAVGFFLYLIVATRMEGKVAVAAWMGTSSSTDTDGY